MFIRTICFQRLEVTVSRNKASWFVETNNDVIADYGYNVKEIFLSKDLEETWMTSYMICLNSGLELLRIESADELLTVMDALKLNWLKFEDKIWVDGIKTKQNIWKYLTNEKNLDAAVYNLTKQNSDNDSEKCMSIFKNGLAPEFAVSDCYFGDVKKFACQKITQQYARSIDNDHGPLKVDVTSRVLEDIGSYETFEAKHVKRNTYFVNRDSASTTLTMTKALNFCKSFGMNLVNLNDQNKFDWLTRLIVKNEAKVNQMFLIGGTRSSVIESQSWVNFVSPGDSASHKNCLSITADQTSDKRRIFYVDCNEKMNFICERVEKRLKEENLYAKASESDQSMAKRTSGMKQIGSLKICK